MSGRAITLPPYGTRGKARKDSVYTLWLFVKAANAIPKAVELPAIKMTLARIREQRALIMEGLRS